MSQEDDPRGLVEVMDFTRALSVSFAVVNIYRFYYPAIREWNVSIGVVDRILLNFQRTAGSSGSILWTKLFSVTFLALSCLDTKDAKEKKTRWAHIWTTLSAGVVLLFFNWRLLSLPIPLMAHTAFYILALAVDYLCLLATSVQISRLLKQDLMDDVFNNENESFMQGTRLIKNEYSASLPTWFYHGKKWNSGWINVVNPFHTSIVLGTPGLGESFAVVNSYIKQQVEKGYTAYIYDFELPDLSTTAYNHLLNHLGRYKVPPKFYVINFDNPLCSHRCNPFNLKFMTDISDAYESSCSIMPNLNRSWTAKQGDFFVELPIIPFATTVWFLWMYKDDRYCAFPHAVESLDKPYEQIFPIMFSYPELEGYLNPFLDAQLTGAADQSMGRITSAKIPLSHIISSALCWMVSADEFSLDINSPDEPKALRIDNNPDRQTVYGAVLGLYNSRIIKAVDEKGRLKSSIITDELPTIFIKGLDSLIAAARSNKITMSLGFQDFNQPIRDYTDKEAKVIINTVGNILSGQIVGEMAKTLSEKFGKILQKRHSISINRQDASTSVSTQIDNLIPPSRTSGLTQGMFVGFVADNFGERIEQKTFHCEIVIDAGKITEEGETYRKTPVITGFVDDDGMDHIGEMIQGNYNRIKEDVKRIVVDELGRIASDPIPKYPLELNK